jgi:hypothetical protein
VTVDKDEEGPFIASINLVLIKDKDEEGNPSLHQLINLFLERILGTLLI